jgi:hypothetical protein
MDKIVNTLTVLLAVAIIPGLFLSLANLEALRWNYGLFREPGTMASSMVVGYILATYGISKGGGNTKLLKVLKYTFLLCILISGMKKVYLSLLLVLFFEHTLLGKFRLTAFNIMLTFLMFTAFYILGLEEILIGTESNIIYFNNVGADGHIRVGMYLAALKMLIDNPLFGVGLGSFGSIGSLVSDFSNGTLIYSISKTYSDYGLYGIADNTDGALNDGKNTLLDTFWPHIVAELGLLGGLAYLILFFYPAIVIKLKDKLHFSDHGAVTFIVYSLIFVRALEGFVSINPELPLFIFFNSVLVPLILSSSMSSRSSRSGNAPL